MDEQHVREIVREEVREVLKKAADATTAPNADFGDSDSDVWNEEGLMMKNPYLISLDHLDHPDSSQA